MTTLEQVTQMKNQGMPETEIIQSLQNQGVSPKEINDSLAQSKIKQAISGTDQETTNMQPSMMGGNLSETVPSPTTTAAPIPAQAQSQEEIYTPQMPQNAQAGTYQYSSAPSYEGGESYAQGDYQDYGSAENSTDTTIEIAEQVFLEKTKKIQKQINDFLEFKTLFQTKVENMEERLRRMEKMFEQLQISIIEKVGNYGKGLENVKKEINMVEDSFSKILEKKIKRKTSSRKKK